MHRQIDTLVCTVHRQIDTLVRTVPRQIHWYGGFSFELLPFELSQVTILRKIRGNSQESFLGIRRNSQDYLTAHSSENVDSFS